MGFRGDLAPGNPTVMRVSPLDFCSHSCSFYFHISLHFRLTFFLYQIDFSPRYWEYIYGNLYHVLMTHNKGERATSLLPIDGNIWGKSE